MTAADGILFSGGAPGAEAAFGAAAERFGVEEVHFTTLRKILQTLWYQVNNGPEIYVVGSIQADGTVRGGTGWGAEFAKLCNKPLYVFDQDHEAWSRWTGDDWERLNADAAPVITHMHFTGTGTRTLRDNGTKAIEDLFRRSFR